MTTQAIASMVTQAKSGDRAAFERLVDGCRDVVCTIALAIVRDLAASEDVAQEVFVAAWSGLGSLRNPESFLPWLRQMTRNRAHEWMRTRARQRLAAGDPEPLLAQVAEPAPDASAAIVRSEEERALAAAIDELPDDAREVVLLYYREGRSAAQVAMLLDLSEDAVKKRLSRAREALRDATAEKLGGLLAVTAPGAAFSKAVLAAIPVGSPGATLLKAAGLARFGKLLAFVGSGAFLGASSAIAGILWGARQSAKQALDDEERRSIRRIAIAQIVVTLIAAPAMLFAGRLAHPDLPVWGVYLAFAAALAFTSLIWEPRVAARRYAAEAAADPEGARLRRARERRRRILGNCLGIALGATGVILGLHFTGR